jgi:hypothetical protein
MCVVCGEPFYVSNYFINKRPAICCSKKCLGVFQSGKGAPRWKGKTREYACKQCGRVFMGKQYRTNNARNFCSSRCYHLWLCGANNYRWEEKVAIPCTHCGRLIFVPATQTPDQKRIYCSRSCFRLGCTGPGNPMYGRSGEKSPTWNGGASYEPYTSAFVRRTRYEVRQRDKHLCQFCGAVATWRALPVHHIDGDKKNEDQINLIALCDSCHSLTYGKPETRQKWQFFYETYQELRLLHSLKIVERRIVTHND